MATVKSRYYYLCAMKKLWIVAFALVLFLFSSATFAQFSDSVNHFLSFSGTGNLNRTSTGTTYLFNNALKFEVNKKKIAVNSLTNYTYGENPTQKTNNDFISIVNVDWLKSVQKLYYWGLAGYEKSFSLKIDDRFQIGGGLGYSILSTPKSSLVVSNGILYETSELREPNHEGETGYQTIRNSFRLKFRFNIKDLVTIDGSDFVQNSLKNADDYIIKVNTNIAVKLYKWLNLTMAINYNRQNITNTENLLLSYGLMFERYF